MVGPSGGRSKSGDERGDDASATAGMPGKRTRAEALGGIQRKPAQGSAAGAAEAQADAAGASVAAGAPAGDARIVPDDTVPATGQLRRSAFLDQVHTAVIQTATEALGWAGAAVGCPYIERWFEKHRDIDAAALERMARRYAELGQPPATAVGYIAPICQRLTAGVEAWCAGRDISAQLAAAGLSSPAGGAVPSPGAIPGAAVQHKAAPGAPPAPPPADGGPPQILGELGPGEPMDGGTQARMGGAFGTSFGDVRVHTDAQAGALATREHAHAFTVGSHVAFAPGRYAPGSVAGDALLAHELTHVLQQRGAAPEPPRHKHVDATGDDAVERDADQGAYGALRYLYDGFMSGVTAARANASSEVELRRCSTDEITSTLVTQPIWKSAVAFDGDSFDVDVHTEAGAVSKAVSVVAEIRYAGSDDASVGKVSIPLQGPTIGRTPAPRVTATPEGAWKAVDIDVYGDASYQVSLSHDRVLLDGWNPKSRKHVFAAKGSLAPTTTPAGREIVVKSRDAMPAVAAGTTEPGAEGPVTVADTAHSPLPAGDAAAIARRRLDTLLSDPQFAIDAAAAPWSTLRTRLDAATSKSAAPDPASATRLSRLADTLQHTGPALRALGAASKKDAYLPDIADDSIQLVDDVRRLYASAIAASFDGPVDAQLKAADTAFNAVWFRITSLYLQKGRGADKMLSDARWAGQEVNETRGQAGRGSEYWPKLEELAGVPPTAKGGGSFVHEAQARYEQVRQDFIAGKPGVLARTTKVVEDAQLVMGLAALLTMNEAMYAFKKEMSGIVGGVTDTLGRDLTAVCGGYITQFEKIINATEGQLVPGGDPSGPGKAAIAQFQGIVAGKPFTSDMDAIRSRIKTIKVIETVGKVLAIVGVAALTGGAAGAAVGGALEGTFGAGMIAASGEFVAEVATFTLVSRTGNQMAFGKNDTSLGEDLITNALMFGFLKAAAAGYGRVFKILADPRKYKAAYAVGGAVTGMLSLQAFAEVHFRVKEGKWMDGGDRTRSVLSNAMMLAALGLGGYLAKPFTARIRNDMLIFAAKNVPGRMEAIGTKIASLKAELDAMKTGDPAAAERAPELLRRIEELWNQELGVLAEAAKHESAKKAEANKAFQDTVKAYVGEIAKIDLQLSQAGVEVDLGAGKAGNFFRPIAPGVVAFKPAGLEILHDFYGKDNKGGTFEQVKDGLFAGKANGEETFYVPEARVKDMLLDTPSVDGLKDTARDKPAAGKDTNLADFDQKSGDFAHKMGAKVGGEKGAIVEHVEVTALAADAQVEAGLRVLDPVFGKNSSAAFKARAKAIQDGGAPDPGFGQLSDARDAAMKAMLDVMRDPSLDLAARKSKLKQLLQGYKKKVADYGKLTGDLGLDAAERAIDALTQDTFADMITADSAGNLAQRGKKIGTLRTLIDQIKAVNNVYRKSGVPREFAISISTPDNPKVPREVKVLSREPRNAPDPTKKPATPVDPTDQDAPGTVVDIGVGLGSYARDAAGETGDLVQSEFGPKYADPGMVRRDLTWENTAPRVDADSVVILGDALQTLSMMFPARSVKRLFINNINAEYTPGGPLYRELALGLRNAIASGGRVEVQWTDAPEELPGGGTKPRGHITGEALQAALDATAGAAPRTVSVDKQALPVTDFDYSVEAPRPKTGASKTPPSNPVPKFRWVFTFGD